MKLAIKIILFMTLSIALMMLIDKITVVLFGKPLAVFITIFGIIVFVGVAHLYSRRSLSAERLADTRFNEPNTPIPAKLQVYHDEILSLGFHLEKEHSTPNPNPLSSARQIIWLYVNPERTVVAWLHRLPRIDFDSYFADGFSTSTQYPGGDNIENEMLDHSIVSTSITAAFDYHLHHCDMLMAEHGAPVIVTDWEIVKQYQYSVLAAYHKHLKKLSKAGIVPFVRYAIVFVGLMILSSLYMEVFDWAEANPEAINPLLSFIMSLVGVVVVLSPLIWIGFGLWRFIQSVSQNTVEARKAKKREMSN